jgi:hypothetical protein
MWAATCGDITEVLGHRGKELVTDFTASVTTSVSLLGERIWSILI